MVAGENNPYITLHDRQRSAVECVHTYVVLVTLEQAR